MRRRAQAIDSRTHASERTAGAHDAPSATSGRFCRRIRPKRQRSASVSPGRRCRKRTTPAENRTEVRNPCQNHGPFSAKPPRSRMAQATGAGDRHSHGCGHKPRNFSHLPTCALLWRVLVFLAPEGRETRLLADRPCAYRSCRCSCRASDFPYNLISDALRVVARASLPLICAFPVAS